MTVFYTYTLTNHSKIALYVGVTNNLERRVIEHKEGSHNAFTSRYGIKYLVYFEEYSNVEIAIGREKTIKSWRREKKDKLIETTNPYWKFLNEPEY